MSGVLDLVRPEIRELRAYRAADYVGGLVRLNANESPWRPPGDESRDGLNRYPDPRPAELARRLAEHYGVAAEQILVTRGSSEAIDLLARAFCRAGLDELFICPPTFGMYEVYGRIQGAVLREVPLARDEDPARDWGFPTEGIVGAWNANSRLVFVCSPNNPTGTTVPLRTLHELCERLAGRGVVVVDGAYTEFADEDPMPALLKSHENVVVLRTLSKAMSLAGVRCGALLASADLVDVVARVLPPYCFPTTSQDAVLRCLGPDAGTSFRAHREELVAERERLAAALAKMPGIERVWPSAANFLLLRAADPRALVRSARAGGVLVRDFSWDPWLPGCIRVTVGTPGENDRLIDAWGRQ